MKILLSVLIPLFFYCAPKIIDQSCCDDLRMAKNEIKLYLENRTVQEQISDIEKVQDSLYIRKHELKGLLK